MEKTFEQQEKELIAHLEQICPKNNERLDIGYGLTIYRMEKGTAFDCWQFSTYGMNTYIHVKEKTNRPESISFHRQLLGICERDAVQAERERCAKQMEEACRKAYHKAYKQAQVHATEGRSFNPNDLFAEWWADVQPDYKAMKPAE